MNFKHITGTGAQVVSPGRTQLHRVVVNKPAAGTITITDAAGNTVAIITATSGGVPFDLDYGGVGVGGLTVNASAAMDITVIFGL